MWVEAPSGNDTGHTVIHVSISLTNAERLIAVQLEDLQLLKSVSKKGTGMRRKVHGVLHDVVHVL